MRGAGAGAANSGICYLSDSVGLKPGWPRPDMGSLMGMAGRLIPPFGLLRDPKKGCGSVSLFAPILGYGSARGYRYDLPKTGGAGQKQKKFSLMEFLKETAAGGITGGVASTGFYGAGYGIETLSDSFCTTRSNNITQTEVTSYYPVNDGAIKGTKKSIYLMTGDKMWPCSKKISIFTTWLNYMLFRKPREDAKILWKSIKFILEEYNDGYQE